VNEQERFVNAVTDAVPRLRRLLDRHVAQFDELLPHVFMGAVSRFAIGAFQRCTTGVARACLELDALLAAIEQGWVAGGEDVHELIGVSFLENVAEDVAGSRELQSRLGPVLRREVQVYLDAYGTSE
jgi:hypothetical protein